MTRTLTFDHTPKELALRRSGTCEVALFWSRRTHRAAVKLMDEATGWLGRWLRLPPLFVGGLPM